MNDADMTMDEILVSTSEVLVELARELVRRGDEEYRKDPQSQASACFFLAIHAVSLLCGIGTLLQPQTRDSLKVLMRGYLEARDLLLTFRFDDQGIRNKVVHWFAGNMDSSWKAEHKRCDTFFAKLGFSGTDFGKKWSQTTTLAHPTRYAAQNSVACATLWAGSRVEDFTAIMELETADYLTAIAELIVIATYDFSGLIPMGCDLNRMPKIDPFRQNVYAVAVPILNKNRDGSLPPNSYRS